MEVYLTNSHRVCTAETGRATAAAQESSPGQPVEATEKLTVVPRNVRRVIAICLPLSK